jgi:hypothetical protein
MSTQPIERRRLPVVRRRRPEFHRLLATGLLFAGVFAATFLIGHTRSGTAAEERLPPSLPAVATPVPAALSSAPPIEVGVSRRQIVAATPRVPARAASTTESPAPATPAASVPAASTPAASTPASTTPAPTVAPPAVSVTPGGGARAPAPSRAPSGSGSGGGSQGGKSFDSSG